MKPIQSMKAVLRWMVVGILFLAVRPAGAAPRPGEPNDFGLGILLGSPTGLSAKYWMTPTTAIDGALAWHFGREDRLQVHADHLWHITISGWDVPEGRMPVFVGAGFRVIAGDRSEAGLRVPVGLTYLFNQAPVEIFAEIVPVLEVAPDTEAELDGGIGVRYYFKTR